MHGVRPGSHLMVFVVAEIVRLSMWSHGLSIMAYYRNESALSVNSQGTVEPNLPMCPSTGRWR